MIGRGIRMRIVSVVQVMVEDWSEVVSIIPNIGFNIIAA